MLADDAVRELNAVFRTASTPANAGEGQPARPDRERGDVSAALIPAEADCETVTAVVRRRGTRQRHPLTHPGIHAGLSDCA